MDIICDGGDSSGSVTANAVGGTPPYTYNWSPGGGTTATLSALSVGTYTVSVNDANGCKGSATATIKALPPSLYLCCDTTIIQGGSGIITADSSLYYKWEPATGLNCDTCQIVIASPTITTTYTVTGTDGNGCTVVKEITVIVENVCAKFTVPNVFTPDFQGSSGVNNVFYIKTVDLSAWSITIYDRWGKEMYTSNNPDVYWDGNTEGGSKASDGVYYYIISATCQGNTYKRDGFVQLIR
jgi:gliding motility-associated-like protein